MEEEAEALTDLLAKLPPLGAMGYADYKLPPLLDGHCRFMGFTLTGPLADPFRDDIEAARFGRGQGRLRVFPPKDIPDEYLGKPMELMVESVEEFVNKALDHGWDSEGLPLKDVEPFVVPDSDLRVALRGGLGLRAKCDLKPYVVVGPLASCVATPAQHLEFWDRNHDKRAEIDAYSLETGAVLTDLV
jgi:hypothetical protein